MTAANGNSNGDSGRVLKSGVWAPIPTFFDESEELGKLCPLDDA